MEHKENFLHGYVLSMMLNEIFNGQSEEYVSSQFQLHHMQLRIDYDNVYLCISGLGKPEYSQLRGLSTQEYIDCYTKITQRTRAYLTAEHCATEIVLETYHNAKKICILFTPTEGCTLPPMELGAHLHQIVQEVYDGHPKLHGARNFTAISSHITHFEQIYPAFTELFALHRLGWFVPEIGLISPSLRDSLQRPFSFSDALAAVEQLGHCLNENRHEEGCRLLQELLLEKTKYSFQATLCYDTLLELKRLYLRYSQIFGLDAEAGTDALFRPSSYLFLEDCYQVVAASFSQISKAVAKSGVPKSYPTLEALRYIRNHYQQDISVAAMAAYIGVVPAYLSRTFNREMRSSIPAYWAALRMEHAKRLLTETDIKVASIGAQVGMPDRMSFTRKFKSITGMTPSAYREQFPQK